jgi:4-nitrophenyl phosphatase
MPAYDGLIIDLDGVVWRGRVPIDGAAEAIGVLRQHGIRLVFMTNEPGSTRLAFAARLTAIGIPATSADVLTSAAATARTIAALDPLPDRRTFVIGPHALVEEIRAAGLEVVTGEPARTVPVVVVGAHQGFDYQELRTATLALRNGARLFATGRDAIFPSADGPWPGTGAVLAAVETAGGVQAEVVGKPEAVMFELAQEVLAGCERLAIVGDNLSSDIAGAKRAGLHAILVLTGASTRADLDEAKVDPDLVVASIADLPQALGIGEPPTGSVDQAPA